MPLVACPSIFFRVGEVRDVRSLNHTPIPIDFGLFFKFGNLCRVLGFPGNYAETVQFPVALFSSNMGRPRVALNGTSLLK